MVSRKTCADVAQALDLGELLFERAELPPEIRRSNNVLAALIEAAIAALYLEYGLERIEGPIVEAFSPHIAEAEETPLDPKTMLQEQLAQQRQKVSYSVLEVEGPPHERRFTCAALVDGRQAGVGTGRTKKDAEQAAASEALERLAL